MSATTVDIDRIDFNWFHEPRSYRAALYACKKFNRMVQQVREGVTFFDEHGVLKLAINVEYGTQFKVTVTDGELCWVTRIGDVRNEKSGKILLTKKDVNKWLSTIRYLDPKHLQRIRLG